MCNPRMGREGNRGEETSGESCHNSPSALWREELWIGLSAQEELRWWLLHADEQSARPGESARAVDRRGGTATSC